MRPSSAIHGQLSPALSALSPGVPCRFPRRGPRDCHDRTERIASFCLALTTDSFFVTLTTSPESRYQIPGLRRGLRVLEYLGGRCDGATSAEIASGLGLPKSSVYRITITLREAGSVDHDEASDRWTLSQKIVGLGFAAIGRRRLIEEAKREMLAIRDAVQQTTVVCMLHDAEAIIVDEAPGLLAFRFVIEPGHRTPPVFDHQGEVVAAITVTGPSERLHPEDFGQLGELIRRHADRVSQRLGFLLGAVRHHGREPSASQ